MKHSHFKEIPVVFKEVPITTKHVSPYKILRQAGIEEFFSHFHEEVFEVIYMKAGKAQFRVSGQSYTLAAGDLLFIHEGQIHEGKMLDEAGVYYAFLFDRHRLALSDNLTAQHGSMLTGRLPGPVLLRPGDPDYNKLAPNLQSIFEESDQQGKGFELIINAHLLVFIALLARWVDSPAVPNDRPGLDLRHLEKLKEVITYVEERFYEKTTVEQAAKMACMSIHHFCRVFKKAFGRTFLEYLHEYRIAKSEALVLETDWPIAKIAEAVGINDINHFGRLFRKYKHCTPTQLRKNGSSTLQRISV